MKCRNFFVLILMAASSLMLFQRCKSDNHPIKISEIKSDTLSIDDFRAVVNTILKDGFKYDDKSVILNIKTANSIWSYDLSNQQPYQEFEEKFSTVFLRKIITSADCEPSIGMSLYSKKFKLLIGGPKFPDNSFLVITGLNE